MTDFQPKPQTPEQVDEGLRNAFRQAIKDGVIDATPYLKKMTFNTDIEKTEAEIKVLQKKLELLKEIETHKSQPRMEFSFGGKFEVVSYNDEVYYRLEFPDEFYWYKKKYSDEGLLMVAITDGETHRLLEGLWFNDVKKGKYDEPYCPNEPEHYDEVEWDEKDNPQYRITDEIVDKLIKQHQAQKLYNRLYDELGYDFEDIENVVSLIEDWLPEPQSAEGSQNVNTELLVDGFNHCLEKIKGMLR
jgi:hypothetical protein